MGTADTRHRLAPALCAPEAAGQPHVRLRLETHAQVTTTTGRGGAGGQAHWRRWGEAGGHLADRGPQVGPSPAGERPVQQAVAGPRAVPHLRGERLPRGAGGWPCVGTRPRAEPVPSPVLR